MQLLSHILMLLLLAGCSKATSNASYAYPHDFKRRDLAKLYLVNDSRGHSVSITANDVLVWRGVVGKSDLMPNIHPVGIPTKMQQKCRVRITGKPYTAERDVDWQKGKALIVNFADDRVVFAQQEEPVGFQ